MTEPRYWAWRVRYTRLKGIANAPFAWMRQRLGTCQMGHGLRGCWRRPTWTWAVMPEWAVPLCDLDRASLIEQGFAADEFKPR